MNRYDYYTRSASFDEQEWMTEELYYPDYSRGADYDEIPDEHYDEGWDDYDDECDYDDDECEDDEQDIFEEEGLEA